VKKQIKDVEQITSGTEMTISFCVRTNESPKTVGDVVCSFNYTRGEHPEDEYTWVMEERKSGIEEYWEIKSKYAGLKAQVSVGFAYRKGDTVILSDVNDDFAPNFLDPLLEKYGFDNLKWIVTPKPR
jgi:hypothetical protein